MNENKEFERAEKALAKTHLTFKRSANAEEKGKLFGRNARPLKKNAGGLAQYLLNALDSIAPIIAKSAMTKALRESGMPAEDFEPLVEEIYENQPKQHLKLSDLLEEVRELSQ
jgi:hypothetical protein